MKTALNKRTLWYDGDSVFPLEDIERGLRGRGASAHVFVDCIDKAVTRFNKLVPVEQQLNVKTKLKPLSFQWNLPKQYADLNTTEYVLTKLFEKGERLLQKELEIREQRTLLELKLFRKCRLSGFLKALIYIVETLEANNIIWGIGRGSSVASYVLFLIRVHDVDSVHYDIDMMEFFKIPVS